MKNDWPGIVQYYREYLPILPQTVPVTLGEGGTPLVPLDRVVEKLGIRLRLYAKVDGQNPTGSFKDRGMTLAVTKARERGAKALICASTGNTSASAAAYGARAGLTVYVVIPEGKIAKGKLAQAVIHNAVVIQIQGLFDEALQVVRDISATHPVALVNSVNPDRLEGQKTVAFEICDVLGHEPNYHFLPVGNAGNITASWMGYREYKMSGKLRDLPRMVGVQAEGAAPIVRGHVVEKPETIASAIRIGNPASWQGALKAASESRGDIIALSDEKILEAYWMLAKEEGVFCEPASAASLAGVIEYARNGRFLSGDVVVCTLTGHGLKDPETALSTPHSEIRVPPGKEAVLRVLGF
ncbi:threonine synthase [Leptospirillum ferriphilum]|jgi:threonine synthase|uniref:Threonine synthase n=2 Tax=Leptospirillum TaxID=179 RepID=A0A094X4Q7_9BACT|nr:threonine synthase [Leptospirillum ferriphilum]EDZ38918.1 MAG: Threonine synthase [Leptospirillum sp. Group II '5-way CG']KGA93524.1 Threonine synthase [Leptospirillum ferriphilum]